MCLTSFRKEPFISDKDIVCYKELEIAGDGRYVTPFTKTPVELGKELVGEEIGGNDIQLKHDFYCNNDYVAIDKGYIHAYLSIPETPVVGEITYNKILVKSIIPDGTEFYLGNSTLFALGSNIRGTLDYTICAKKIIIGNEILTSEDIKLEMCRGKIAHVSSLCGVEIDEGDYTL